MSDKLHQVGSLARSSATKRHMQHGDTCNKQTPGDTCNKETHAPEETCNKETHAIHGTGSQVMSYAQAAEQIHLLRLQISFQYAAILLCTNNSGHA